MGKGKLTKRDLEILDFIKSYIAQHGYAPNYREIGEGIKLNSTASVYGHVRKLIAFGEIETDHPELLG